MRRHLKILLLGVTGTALALVMSISQAQQTAAVPQELRAKLVQALETSSSGQLEILSIKVTTLPSIFEVELNTGEILYSDVAGDYLFAGDMYRTSATGLVNLSTDTRQARTLTKLAAIPEEEMIIFTPDVVKASITVFTDVDCGYCRKLHEEIDDLLGYGIEVRYMAYPRGGEQADAYEKMISVWCSDDRQRNLTRAKHGQNLPAADCETPILAHYALGNELGISGTPALVLPNGRLIPGYMEAPRLAAMLGVD